MPETGVLMKFNILSPVNGNASEPRKTVDKTFIRAYRLGVRIDVPFLQFESALSWANNDYVRTTLHQVVVYVKCIVELFVAILTYDDSIGKSSFCMQI